MPRRLAVAIGVASVPGTALPYLGGVRQGLDDFRAWAEEHDFAVTVHDDAEGPVHAKAVYSTIRDAVLAADVERLFVFFGGHGLATGIGDDLWLLSEAAEDGAEAVNVASSARLARHCGIPHVVFFADACRTPPEARFLGVTGRAIFPLERVPRVRVQVDEFYAVQSGDPALERAASAGTDAFGIFSRCLMEVLRGKRDEVLTPVDDGPASHALLARPLADYLYAAVPELSTEQAGVPQYPDCIPMSAWQPNALAWFDRSRAAPDPVPVPRQAPVGAVEPTRTLDVQRHIEHRAVEPQRAGSPWRPPDNPVRRTHLARLAERIAARPGREHFETRIGASVSGAEVLEAWVQGVPAQAFEEDGAWHVRGQPDQPATLFLRLGDDQDDYGWTAGALLPGYVTTIAVGRAGVENVAFAQLGDDDRDDDLRATALASAALRTGDLGFVDDDDVARLLDGADPTMSVLAAYALDRAGQEDDVRTIFERCRDTGRPVPFDVALLAEAVAEAGPRLLPAFPLMRRGWALADAIPSGDRWLTYARPRLGRTAWTTFTELSPGAIAALGRIQEGAHA